jgi:hypothetical protein
MLYAKTTQPILVHSSAIPISTTTDYVIQGHIDNENLGIILNGNYNLVTEIQADGDELVHCCQILGRQLPTTNRVYTFVGDNAREIAINW